MHPPKNLQELAQTMKEKMEKAMEANIWRKVAEVAQVQVREKEQEIVDLRSQLWPEENMQKTLKTCQKELIQSQEECRQLREKLQLQQGEKSYPT